MPFHQPVQGLFTDGIYEEDARMLHRTLGADKNGPLRY